MSDKMFPCLWFDGKAKEAAEFYCSVFQNSRILEENPVVVLFELNGNRFMGLNGGPIFTLSEAFSIVVNCDTQDEIDYYWEALTKDGGKESRCGWLKDKFGLSWQIVPSILSRLMRNPEKIKAITEAYMKMNKMIIADLKKAGGIE